MNTKSKQACSIRNQKTIKATLWHHFDATKFSAN